VNEKEEAGNKKKISGIFGCVHLKKYYSVTVRLQQLFKMAVFSMDTQSNPLQHTYRNVVLLVNLSVHEEEECLLRVLIVHFTKSYCKC
jgi:hypothetical protein